MVRSQIIANSRRNHSRRSQFPSQPIPVAANSRRSQFQSQPIPIAANSRRSPVSDLLWCLCIAFAVVIVVGLLLGGGVWVVCVCAGRMGFWLSEKGMISQCFSK
jgi:hypothetical protein